MADRDSIANTPLPPLNGGIDMRDPPERADTVAYANNLNFSQQPLRVRKSFVDIAQRYKTHWIRHHPDFISVLGTDMHRRIATIDDRSVYFGHNSQMDSLGTAKFYVFDPTGKQCVGHSFQSLGYNEATVGRRRRRWANVTYQGRLYFQSGAGPMLVYSPLDGEGQSATTDESVKRVTWEEGWNSPNVPYLSSGVPAQWMFVHANRIWWGGIPPNTTLELDGAHPEYAEGSEHFIPDHLLDSERKMLHLGANHTVFSDPYFPNDLSQVAVGATNFIGLEDEYPLTGGCSYRGNALLFTRKSVWRVSGYKIADMRVQRLSNSVGCVAHRTIREAGNLVYFLAEDGIYATDGSGVKKVSGGVDPIFGRNGSIPRLHTVSQKYELKPPPIVHKERIHDAIATVYHPDNQYWVALPTLPESEHWHGASGTTNYIEQSSRNLILVYDYEKKVTFFYSFGQYDNPYVTGERNQSGIQAFSDGPVGDVVYVNRCGALCAYGADDQHCDLLYSTDGHKDDIPVALLTRRYGTEDQKDKHFSRVRLAISATGKDATISADKIFWFAKESDLVRDGTSHEEPLSSGTLTPHPFDGNTHFWGAFTWGDGTKHRGKDRFIADLPINHRANSIQVGFYEEAPFSKLEIHGIGVDVSQEDQT